MQRQFQQPIRVKRFVYLRCARAISHGFVVTNGGIIRRAGRFKSRRRLLVIVKPVHPHADFGVAGQGSNLFNFLAPPRAVNPCINPVQSDFAARSRQLPNRAGNIPSPVSGSPELGRRAIQLLPRQFR